MSFGTFSTFQSFEHNSNNVVNISPNPPTSLVATATSTTSESVAFTLSTTSTSSPFSSFTPSAYGVTGTTTSGYKIYTFTSTSTTYTIPYTCGSSQQMYILAVGGGGAGGNDNAGGGGAGGVVLATKTIPSGSDTITITVGAGEVGGSSVSGGWGGTTNVSFATNTGLNVIAGGGGGGTSYNAASKRTDGSSSGGSGSGTTMQSSLAGGLANNSNNNLANNGGAGTGQNNNNSGGGGAGTAGSSGNTLTSGHYGNGGDGVLCTLNGIKDFGSYGSYYWGGGGGGAAYTRVGGNGGKGGGGGGNYYSLQSSTAGLGDTSGINAAYDGTNYNVATNNGHGGVNTGGGGGGASNVGGGSYGGNGGSGIVIIAIFNSTISYTITSSPGSLTGTGSASPISVTGLTVNTAYTFTGTATNSSGKSSVASSASSSVSTLPNITTAVSVSSFTASQIVLAYAGNYSYVNISRVGDGTIATGVVGTSYTDTTVLSSNTSYTYIVTPYNVDGSGGTTSSITQVTLPNPPTGVSATSSSSDSISVSFTASTGSGGGTITYNVMSSGSSIGSGTSSPISITGLSYTKYILTVTATNSSGTSWSPTIINSHFDTPTVSTNSYIYYTDFSSITGWTFSGNSYVLIVRGSTPWTYTSSVYPVGSSQALAIQFTGSGTTRTVSQSITLIPGTYTVRFYARPRNDDASFYSTLQQMTCSLNGNSVTTALIATDLWVLYSFSTTISTSGTYPLSFFISGGSTDTSISLTKIIVALSSASTTITTLISAAPIGTNIFATSNMTVSNMAVSLQNGVYYTSASSYSEGQAYLAFNGSAITYWHCQYPGYVGGSTPAYTQEVYVNGVYQGGGATGTYFTTTTTTITASGEWMQIQFPYYLQLVSYDILPRNTVNRSPKTFYVVGSRDGTTWVIIDTQTGVTPFTSITTFTLTTTPLYYKYFRIIFYALEAAGAGSNVVNISEWNLKGYGAQ